MISVAIFTATPEASSLCDFQKERWKRFGFRFVLASIGHGLEKKNLARDRGSPAVRHAPAWQKNVFFSANPCWNYSRILVQYSTVQYGRTTCLYWVGVL